MIVSVVGLGYIGLPTAAIIASNEVKVIGVDVNKDSIKIINEGRAHIIEPELDSLVKKTIENGSFIAKNKPQKSDVFIIAVPTPFLDDNSPDISYIISAVKSLAPVLEKGNIIILESTSPVGTTEEISKLLASERKDLMFPNFGNESINFDISIAYCPERVMPGNIICELVENDRIIGGITKKCSRRAIDIYKIFVKADCVISDCRTAELAKLVENSFRDVNIAFANELSLICDRLNINVWDLIKLANHHPRVNILNPGPGVGGHCIAVDPWFIINSLPDHTKLIKTAREVNDKKPQHVLGLIDNAIKSLSKENFSTNISCLGISYKADIDDLRGSPALEIVKSLSQYKINRLNIVEPNISELPESIEKNNINLISLDAAIKDADIIVILVGHYEFKSIDKKFIENKVIIDTLGILN
jgi:UDP-N-acetyl-D-mannosaminuronic acid dehydrogenase